MFIVFDQLFGLKESSRSFEGKEVFYSKFILVGTLWRSNFIDIDIIFIDIGNYFKFSLVHRKTTDYGYIVTNGKIINKVVMVMVIVKVIVKFYSRDLEESVRLDKLKPFIAIV